jgi:hypothetical protein
MLRSERYGLQDEEIQGALWKFDAFAHAFPCGFYSKDIIMALVEAQGELRGRM